MDTGYAATALGWPVYLLLWLFFVYGFLGVVIETVFCLVREGHLESRLGLLYLPLRPMYGVGGVACVVFLDRFQQQPILVFLGGVAICSMVEYAAGTICDKAFGTISWDYRSKLLHLHGRICLEYSCYWGLLSWLTVSVLNPWVAAAVGRFDRTAGETVLTVLLVLTLTAMLLTVAAWVRVGERIVVLTAQSEGRVVPLRDTAAARLVDRLVPDPLMIMIFPRTKLVHQLAALTGREPASSGAGGHLASARSRGAA